MGARDTELLHHQVLRAGRHDLGKHSFEGVGNELGAGLHQDSGGGGQYREKRKQRRVSSALGDGEAVIVESGHQASPEEPGEGPQAHRRITLATPVLLALSAARMTTRCSPAASPFRSRTNFSRSESMTPSAASMGIQPAASSEYSQRRSGDAASAASHS